MPSIVLEDDFYIVLDDFGLSVMSSIMRWRIGLTVVVSLMGAPE